MPHPSKTQTHSSGRHFGQSPSCGRASVVGNPWGKADAPRGAQPLDGSSHQVSGAGTLWLGFRPGVTTGTGPTHVLGKQQKSCRWLSWEWRFALESGISGKTRSWPQGSDGGGGVWLGGRCWGSIYAHLAFRESHSSSTRRR